MATGTIPYDRMLGYKLIVWEGTTPAVNVEYRQNVTGAANDGHAMCVGMAIKNGNNNYWYQQDIGYMNGQSLRFTVTDAASAGQQFIAFILSK